MISKFLHVGIIGFWLVMTGLLLRYVYFPDQSRLTEVAPQKVIDLMLHQEEAMSPFNLWQEGRKVGNMNLGIRAAKDHPGWQTINFNGRMDETPGKPNSKVLWNWTGSLQIEGAEKVHGGKLLAHQVREGIDFELNWKGDQEAPVWEIRQGGVLLFSSQKAAGKEENPLKSLMAQSMMSAFGGQLPLTDSAKNANASGRKEQPLFTAAESFLEAGGQRRETYTLSFEPLPGQKVEFYTNRGGELMFVKIPNGIEMHSNLWFAE